MTTNQRIAFEAFAAANTIRILSTSWPSRFATSFAPTRAIVNGPGGSRIMFDGEEVVLGGIPWTVDIQKNGIEFTYGDQRILLLFDKSLSSGNRV